MTTILPDHITHQSGQRKTVCVTAVLTSLGVPVNSFHYTGHCEDRRRNAILNRNGFACRSRLSRIGKNISMGKARAKVAKLNDGPDVKYMVCLRYGGKAHLILLDHLGQTIVDTDPRKRDSRKVVTIHAIWKKKKYLPWHFA